MLMLRVSMAPGELENCQHQPQTQRMPTIEIRTNSQDFLGAMVHACVTMLFHCLETLGKRELIKLRHAHAARGHGTRRVSMAPGELENCQQYGAGRSSSEVSI